MIYMIVKLMIYAVVGLFMLVFWMLRALGMLVMTISRLGRVSHLR
ncbi:MAG: hypothetical protein WA708_13880 [Acidobacteriaceae bacterium]